jgi:hypothetical protein
MHSPVPPTSAEIAEFAMRRNYNLRQGRVNTDIFNLNIVLAKTYVKYVAAGLLNPLFLQAFLIRACGRI